MKCPKCDSEMRNTEYQGVTYDRCRNCGGLWFDALEAEELVEITGAADIDTEDAKQGAEYNKKRIIDCPTCNARMRKVKDQEQPHIQLETCPACKGTFFDAGEFKDFCEETFMDRVKDWLAQKR
jgi:Zn-finger nucleic acid-binding protein